MCVCVCASRHARASTADISDALSILFANDIKPRLDPGLFVAPDEFRANFLYKREVVEAVAKHESSLRLLFDGVACQSRYASLGMLIGLAEWKHLMKMLGLINIDITDRDITLCFIFARMTVIDSWTEKGRIKDRNLPFEGFVEAVIRLSVLKAWPLDDELFASGFPDAGLYMLNLRKDEQKHHKLLSARNVDWGANTYLPVARCVEHMLILIIHTVERIISTSKDDGKLDPREMKRWEAKWGAKKKSKF